jgi:hypothetical protein
MDVWKQGNSWNAYQSEEMAKFRLSFIRPRDLRLASMAIARSTELSKYFIARHTCPSRFSSVVWRRQHTVRLSIEAAEDWVEEPSR